jgi:hypothetical protein
MPSIAVAMAKNRNFFIFVLIIISGAKVKFLLLNDHSKQKKIGHIVQIIIFVVKWIL